MSDLPKNWIETTLEDIGIINPKHRRDIDQNTLVSFVPMPFVREDSSDLQLGDDKPLSEVSKGYTHFCDGDVLFAKITPCMENGKAAVATNLKNKLGCGSTELHVLRPLGNIPPQYIYSYLHQKKYRDGARNHMTGSAGQLRVPGEYFKKSIIPLPPLNEQRRIVAKLDQLLPKVRLCEERLEKVTVIMKRFRQSVLAAACSGKLTADWRKEKKIDPNWKAIKLGSLISMLDQGWSPKCKINNSPSDSIWGVIKTTAVQPMKFDESENKELPDALSPKPHFEIQVDDLLITRAGPRVRAGVCCLVRSTRPKLMICDKVYRFRVIKQETLPQFIECALNNPLMVEYIDTLKTGISDSGLNLTQEKFRDIEIELPSLNEQNEIVRRVESLFKIADEIESRYQKAKVNIEKLTQSILAKAFRGELVAQDPNDEPASVLLERIRAEKSTHSAKPPKKKKGKMYKTRPSEREVVNG